MTSNLPSQYLNVLELDPAPESVFQFQTAIAETAIHRGRAYVWSESSSERHWLLAQAQAGNFHAMESLAERSLASPLEDDRQNGALWLRRAAEAGSASAQMCLGERLLDGEPGPAQPDEGARWLGQSAASGYRRAVASLALRLLEGDGVEENEDRGREMLRDLAVNGDVAACATIAAHSFGGRGFPQEEASRWLQRCGAVQPAQIVKIALFLYADSLAAPTLLRRRRGVRAAAMLLAEMAGQGEPAAIVNLAYLVRRNEISGEGHPSLDEMLGPMADRREPFALMNQALRLAGGVDCDTDWQSADLLVSGMKDFQPVMNWWRARTQSGDAEGHMVLAWLLRHELRADPDGIGLVARTGFARRAGWRIPEWFTSHVGGSLRPGRDQRREIQGG